MADLVSAERAQAILDVCSVYPVGYPPIVAASVQLQKATCALLEAAPDLAETVVSLHAEVKRLSTANIDLLAEAMRLTDRVSDLTLDLHGEREKVAAAEVTRDAALKERDEARAEVAAEREACLRIAMDRAAELDAASPDDYEPGEDEEDDAHYDRFTGAMEIARRIRARRNETP